MAYASTPPLQFADATISASAELPDGQAQTADPASDTDDAEECDNDPITLYPSSRQAAPFCAMIWQAGPGALAEADVWPATRPPRVRS